MRRQPTSPRAQKRKQGEATDLLTDIFYWSQTNPDTVWQGTTEGINIRRQESRGTTVKVGYYLH